MDVVAIIPARSGSKSITDKNIALLAGHPLIAYSIAAAQCSSMIQRVIVSTDSGEYAEIAKKYGAEVPFIRPAAYSTDTSTDRDFLVHAMTWLEEQEQSKPEYWVHLRPTTPLRDPQIIDKAIQLIKESDTATSLRSGYKAPESPLKWFVKNNDGYFQGFLQPDSTEDEERYNLPKEAFEDIYIPDGYVDVLRRSFVMGTEQIHGNKMIGYETPVTTEVDSVEEFEFIQFQLSRHGTVLLNILNSIKEGN